MYWLDSHGLQYKWISTPPGIALSIGSVSGIVAFLLGLTIEVPAAARMAAIQKKIQTEGQPLSPPQMEELHILQEGMTIASRWAAVLMVIAVLGMALARELGVL